MTPEHSIPDDAFADALLSPLTGEANDALRQSILQKTSRQLRMRRQARVVMRAGLVAACFVGGMTTMAIFRSSNPETRVVVVNIPIEKQLPEAVVENRPERWLTASELELEAEKNFVQHESARSFRDAGDRYLREEANYEAALRCYRNFLDEADPTDLTVIESDTWLLTSLKNARRKEIENANAIN